MNTTDTCFPLLVKEQKTFLTHDTLIIKVEELLSVLLSVQGCSLILVHGDHAYYKQGGLRLVLSSKAGFTLCDSSSFLWFLLPWHKCSDAVHVCSCSAGKHNLFVFLITQFTLNCSLVLFTFYYLYFWLCSKLNKCFRSIHTELSLAVFCW